MRKLMLPLLLIVVCFQTKAQTWQDTVTQIEKLFSRYKSENPGAQLAISRNGTLVYSKAWGMADLEHSVALTTTSPTEAGSVSKQFTAAAILLLEQQGKLSLDDDVRKYLPELPDYGHTISLRQMIQHKSGLKDWGTIGGIAGWPRSTKTYTNDDALYIMSRQKTLNHKPGDEYLYSNSNYNALAIIVQRVSGMSLAEFSQKYIFEPAGMKHTQWRDNYRKVVANRAIAYAKSGNNYLTTMPNEYVYGNGGLLTTAEDLLKWTNYYLSGKLGNPSLLEKQLATSAFNNGVMHNYAAGLIVGKYRGLKMISHDGATGGYRASLEAFPELGLVVAWLSNTSEFDGDSIFIASRVSDLFLPKMETAETNTGTASSFAVNNSQLKTYTGWYKNVRTNGGLKVVIKDGKLQFTRNNQFDELYPVAENTFRTNSLPKIEFNGKGFLAVTPARDSVYYTLADSANTNGQALMEYVGEYYSEEAEVTYSLFIKNEKLYARQGFKNEIHLVPTYKDGFEAAGSFVLFDRANKQVSGFRITQSRARNVVFTKVK